MLQRWAHTFRSNAIDKVLAISAQTEGFHAFLFQTRLGRSIAQPWYEIAPAKIINRPITRQYVDALEGQIAWYEIMLEDLGKANHADRETMLSDWLRKAKDDHFPAGVSSATQVTTPRTFDLPYHQTGVDNSSSVYGKTSIQVAMPFMQSSQSEEETMGITGVSFDADITMVGPATSEQDWEYDLDDDNNVVVHKLFTPHSEMCEKLMTTFFHRQYTDYMCLYREYFLRDYQSGGGPHYSDLLMYAICAMGAMANEPGTVHTYGEMSTQDLSDFFANRALELLYGGAMDSPNLTTLQALLLLGQRDIGRGKASKGWLLTGWLDM